jgi:hypothetical protein
MIAAWIAGAGLTVAAARAAGEVTSSHGGGILWGYVDREEDVVAEPRAVGGATTMKF